MEDLKINVKRPPHLVAATVIRDLEAHCEARFGDVSRKLVADYFEAVYRHFWQELDKERERKL